MRHTWLQRRNARRRANKALYSQPCFSEFAIAKIIVIVIAVEEDDLRSSGEQSGNEPRIGAIRVGSPLNDPEGFCDFTQMTDPIALDRAIRMFKGIAKAANAADLRAC